MNDLNMMFNGKSVKQYWFTRSEVQALLKAATAPNAAASLADAELREALETARNGLQWYRDTYPEADSVADDEMMAQIEAALAAAPAQQAGADAAEHAEWCPVSSVKCSCRNVA